MVAAIGIFVIYSSLAATGVLPQVNTKKLLNSGDVYPLGDRGVSHRAPITLEACRMSDSPGDGPENRIYFGAKPIVTKELADRLNKVWDKYYPQYHIEGQDVPWAADYAAQSEVGFAAYYIVDPLNKTETKRPYKSIYKPSEARKALTRGGWWNFEQNRNSIWQPYNLARQGALVEGGLEKGKYPYTMYKESDDPNVTRSWERAILQSPARQAYYQEFPYDQNALANINNQTQQRNARDPQNKGTSQGAPESPEKLGQLTPPGVLPGKTTWSYLTGKVLSFNPTKCPNDPTALAKEECYDVINNPNPMIFIDVKWRSGFNNVNMPGGPPTSAGSTSIISNASSGPAEQHYSIGVRFKDLPKCGQAPIPTNTQAQINEYLNIMKINKELESKAMADPANPPQRVSATGGSPIEDTWKQSDVRVSNGLSPLPRINFWTPRSNNNWGVLLGHNYW